MLRCMVEGRRGVHQQTRHEGCVSTITLLDVPRLGARGSSCCCQARCTDPYPKPSLNPNPTLYIRH